MEALRKVLGKKDLVRSNKLVELAQQWVAPPNVKYMLKNIKNTRKFLESSKATLFVKQLDKPQKKKTGTNRSK